MSRQGPDGEGGHPVSGSGPSLTTIRMWHTSPSFEAEYERTREDRGKTGNENEKRTMELVVGRKRREIGHSKRPVRGDVVGWKRAQRGERHQVQRRENCISESAEDEAVTSEHATTSCEASRYKMSSSGHVRSSACKVVFVLRLYVLIGVWVRGKSGKKLLDVALVRERGAS